MGIIYVKCGCWTLCWQALMAHLYRPKLVTWGYKVRIPVGTDICHRGCAYTALQIVQRHGVYSSAYGNVHYREPLKSFKIRVGHSPGFRLPSVAVLPWFCRKRSKAIFIYRQCAEKIQCILYVGTWYVHWCSGLPTLSMFISAFSVP